jgi:hypothetical protein
VHCTHAPLAAHAVSPVDPEHSPAFVHPRHVLVAGAQIGVVPTQLSSVRHCTHLFVAGLHTVVAPVHLLLLFAVHCTHAPPAAHAARAGSFSAAHSSSAPQASHLSSLPQIGVLPLQFAADVHCTQALVVVSHTGVAPPHVEAVLHCAHWPSTTRHTGSAALFAAHSASSWQPEHSLLDEQIGTAPGQFALVTHPTHLFVLVSHIPPVHAAPLLAVHCTHAPPAAHRARSGSFRTAQSPSPLHPWHPPSLPHKGVVPLQSAAEPHCTHCLSARHTGSAEFFCAHCPSLAHPVHAPSTHTPFVGSVQSLLTKQLPPPPGKAHCRAWILHTRPPLQSLAFSQ